MPQDTQEKLVNLGDKVVGQITLPSLDITPYVGKKVKVEKVEEHEGNFGYFIKIVTEPVATLEQKDKDGNPIVLRASKIFGLQEDENGNIGWGEKTKLGVFLRKKKVDHYRSLVGTEVQTISVTNPDDEKDYLSFN